MLGVDSDNLSLDNQSKKAQERNDEIPPRQCRWLVTMVNCESDIKQDSHTDKTTEALVTNVGKVYGAPAVIRHWFSTITKKKDAKRSSKTLVILKILQR